MAKSKSVYVRPEQWELLQKRALDLSQEVGRIVRPSEILGALIWAQLGNVHLDDVEAYHRRDPPPEPE